MSGIVVAVLAALGFVGSGALALRGSGLPSAARAYAIAFAAGALLALSFTDLFPESLEQAGSAAAVSFVAGFAFPIVVETLTRGHTHHSDVEPPHAHARVPFLVGLTIHNLADGFALGVSSQLASSAAWLLGFGVLVHQLPVGVSVATVLTASGVTRRAALQQTLLLGLAIPLAAFAMAILPKLGPRPLGVMTAAAAGIIAYLGAAHLLPEAQAEHPHPLTSAVFVLTLALITGMVLLGVGG